MAISDLALRYSNVMTLVPPRIAHWLHSMAADDVISSLRDALRVSPDNVPLRPDDEARRELVTEVSPGFALAVNNARVQMAARYQLHKYFYSDEDVENLRGSGHNLQADLRARMVDDMLFLDASASRGQQSVSAFGPGLADNQYSTFNRTEVSTWRISPYLSHRFGSAADLLARYTRDSVETGRDGFGNTKGDSINLVLSSPAERRIGWNLRYDRQELSDRLTGDSSSYSGQAGLTWGVLAPLLLSAGGGYDKYDSQALGGSTGGSSTRFRHGSGRNRQRLSEQH